MGDYGKGFANGLERAIALIENRTATYKHSQSEKGSPALEKAKTNAKVLMGDHDHVGNQALSLIQYLAIFGELPE